MHSHILDAITTTTANTLQRLLAPRGAPKSLQAQLVAAVLRFLRPAPGSTPKNHPGSDPRAATDPEAPWGRNADGVAYTHEQFNEALSRSVRAIYGLPPIKTDQPSDPPKDPA